MALSPFSRWRSLRGCTTITSARLFSTSKVSGGEDFWDNLEQLLEDKEMKNDNDKNPPQWRIIDWKSKYSHFQEDPTDTVTTTPSPVERVLVRNRLVHFKRDDDIRLSTGAPISGNKARKMTALNSMSPQEFPECVVSYGGPQSNSMLALAAIVHFQNQAANATQNSNDVDSIPNKRFVYYTKKLPRFLREQPSGNLFRAQTLGMEIVQVSNDEYKTLFGGDWGGSSGPPNIDPPVPGDSLWVPQGGACEMALLGAHQLAFEIADYWSLYGNNRPLTVFLPGGTCSTALLTSVVLHRTILRQPKYQHLDIRVVVVPCVGDPKYAQRQMLSLYSTLEKVPNEDMDRVLPTILLPTPDSTQYFGQSALSSANSGYFTFGEPHADILTTFREMEQECGISLDLIYGGPAWTVLLRHFRSADKSDLFRDRELMYVHSGGLEGINSQLIRYKYKGLIDEVQLPGKR